MNNIMIYPIGINDMYFFNNVGLLDKYNEIYFVTKRGFINEVDYDIKINEYESYSEKRHIVTDPYKYISNVDILYINEDFDFNSLEIYNLIELALENDVKLIISIDLKNNYNDFTNNTKLTDYNCIKLNEEIKINENIDKIFKMNTPIITVVGADEFTNKFDVQLYVKSFFEKNNYRVSGIGSKKSADLFGMHNIPNWLFENEFSEDKKIKYFNQYIKQIEMHEKPDVIIVGVPKGIIKYDDEFHNDFNVITFEILNSFSSDYTIMCLNYGNYNENNINYFRMVADIKFGLEIDSFVMSNNLYDYSQSIRMNCKQFLKISENQLQKKISEIKEECDVEIYPNTLDELENMCNSIIETFDEYSSINCI